MSATRSTFWENGRSLQVLLGFTVVAILGFGIFALNPEVLRHVPSLAPLYGGAFPFFGQVHVWLSAVVLGAYLVRRAGARWVPAMAAVYAVSLTSELVGTTYGIPFGSYGYSELLGPRWLGRVPVTIPLSWFLMAVPSYALARRAFPGSGSGIARVTFAATLLTVWDLSLDPAMSYLTGYWFWGESGAYYGMPWVNLFGWFATGTAIMGVLHGLKAERWMAGLSLRWLRAYYGLVLLMPFGMVLVAGLWGAVAATLAALAACAFLVSRRPAPQPGGDEPSGRAPVAAVAAGEADLTELGALRDYFTRHSRSFSFAALWFPRDQYRLVASVYAFCRTTDDLVDQANGAPPGEVAARLDRWLALVEGAYEGRPSGIAWLDDLMFVSASAGVPFRLLRDLVDGVRSDLGPVALPDVEALDGYTYRVASVVGLWLCHLHGVRDAPTLRQAAALGRAMQLTNILRDVGEDLRMGRVYLPADLMARHGVTVEALHAMAGGAPIPPAYRSLVDALAARAEADYREALPGLARLPAPFGRATAVAAEVYRGILPAVRRNGYDNFNVRAYTRWPDKIVRAGRGLYRLALERRMAERRTAPDAFGEELRRAAGAHGPLPRPSRVGLVARAAGLVIGAAVLTAVVSASSSPHPAATYTAAGGAVQEDVLQQVRAYYLRGVVSVAAIDSAAAFLGSQRSRSPVLEAYGSAFEVLRAKHAFWPTKKMAHLRRGLPVLDRLVMAHPEHVEIRYLRLLSCYYLPRFLGRGWSVDADVQGLAVRLPGARASFEPTLYREMVRFVLAQGEVGEPERSRLAAALQAVPDASSARAGD